MPVTNTPRWRLIDTGLRSAAENIALDRTMLAGHRAGVVPGTLRFLRFRPSALVGFHQSFAQELRLDYCKARGIELQRRMTGGGAIYFDEAQLGWELYLDRAALGDQGMASIAKRICQAAAEAISQFGVDARFRPRNDIEVRGRKIAGTGGAFDGNSVLYQGTLLLEFDVERMLRVLRIPAEKLSDKAVESARQRVTSLQDLLGGAPDLEETKRRLAEGFAQALGITLEPVTDLSDWEQARMGNELAYVRSPAWLDRVTGPPDAAPRMEATRRTPGGLLHAWVALDKARQVIKQLWLEGDLFVDPPRTVVDLEAALKDTYVRDLEANVQTFFNEHRPQLLMLEPADFIAVIRQAVADT